MNDHYTDLRSDTVTKPTLAMRKAMAEAEVGDDVFGEDPTVNTLQEKVTKILGKEAALFVPSGTMANQLAIKAHTQPGDEVIIEASSHSYNFEGGAGGALSGVQFYLLKGVRGILEPSQIDEVIRPPDHHFPSTKLICLENTHNHGGGSIYPIERMREIYHLAKSVQRSSQIRSRLMIAGPHAPSRECLSGSIDYPGQCLSFRLVSLFRNPQPLGCRSASKYPPPE